MSTRKLDVKMRGDYAKVTAFMRGKQIYTRSELIAFQVDTLGKSLSAASGTADVMLSPRKEARVGADCRGNSSCPWGHLAYNEKLERKVGKDGKKEEQKFRFRFRDVALERKVRPGVKETIAHKTTKVSAKSKVTSQEEVTA
jgi:hypothetical protein